MMKKKKRMLEQYKTWIWSVVGIAVCIVLGALLSGCSLTKYVPVPEVHTEHHWHTDSVFQRDSVVKESLTTVMQLDSAAMATETNNTVKKFSFCADVSIKNMS